MDYALASGGGFVMQHSDPYLVGKGSSWFATTGRKAHTNAVKMLSPSFGEPGQCFALKGSSGYVQIRLRGPIVPEAFTLEHVAKVMLLALPKIYMLILVFFFCVRKDTCILNDISLSV